MPYVAINLAYLIALYEFSGSFDMLYKNLVGIAIEYVRLSFG